MRMDNGSCFSDGSGGSRRQFLKTGAMTLGGLALPELLWRPAQAAMEKAARSTDSPLLHAVRGNKSVLCVFLAGGPSQLDMYDMKPDAPAEIRGEFRPVNTNVSGIRVCERLPLHAKIADKFAIVNGLKTTDQHDPAVMSAEGRSLGARVDVIAKFDVGDQPERLEIKSRKNIPLPHGDWDTHGRVLGRQLSIFQELREKLPAYDRFIYDLITDVYNRSLENDVLIIACGEFGRTPWINQYGGRNHWAPSGSVLLAGGGLKMGQVIGDTGPIGERDTSRGEPYNAGNIQAMIFRHLGFDLNTLWPGAQPISELI